MVKALKVERYPEQQPKLVVDDSYELTVEVKGVDLLILVMVDCVSQ